MIDKFQNAPKGVQIVVALAGGAGILGVAAMIDSRAVVIVAIGMVLVVGAIFLWQFWLKWRARRRAKALSGQLSDNSAAAPAAISDLGQRAKLDALRTTFSQGLERYTAAGKDLYTLPWYVVCGEPGSGKSEAVRHCNVGFPPGMHGEMQGAGGTINMQWWFTNHAVLIDTAGKLLFQEAPAGTTTEWQEFLQLLRKTRPNCPINGLLLVIPSESLIRDSFEDIQRKAGKIAQQLDTIQRTLDIRFPVYVLITKCDLINGFREFFAGVKDPQLQHQMTGWSNPESLDTPFKPEAVDQHLVEVVRRMSRRRLGLMRDPVPVDASKRRIDEIDALCALPASIGALAPRLRKYLGTIFVPGEWGAKPLFLRGIYFTSALTEGAALDAELATALGLPVDQLPEGKAWERERSYFLRDLFVQKIFKENGLVTRAGNTGKLIQRRRRIIGGVVLLGLTALVVVSVLGQKALKSSVGGELIYWRAGVNAENWSGPRWRPIVNSNLEYTGNDMIKLEDGREWPIVEFHEKLRQLVSTDLHIPWVFKPVEKIAVRANPGRRKAQRILFEASAIAPLLDATSDRLINATSWSPADSERLAALIELEGSIHLKDLAGFNADYPPEDFFNPLLGPSLAKVPDSAAILNRLAQTFEWTYSRSGFNRGLWPPARFSRGTTLRDNQPLMRGWDALDRSMQAAQNSQADSLKTIQSGRLLVVRFNDAEKAFLAAVDQPRTEAAWATNVLSAWGELVTRRTGLDNLVDDLKSKTGVTGDVTLDGSYRATVGRIRDEAGRTSQRIRLILARQKPAADAASRATSGAASEFTLYRDLERRLASLQAQIAAQVEQLLPASEQAQLAELDGHTLKAITGGTAAYAARCSAYAEALRVMAPAQATGASLFGRLGDPAGQQASALVNLRDRVGKYDGAQRPEFSSAMAILLEAAALRGVEATYEAYRREFDRAFADTSGYPLGSGPALTAEQLRARIADLAKIRTDAAAAGIPAEARRTLESRFDRAAQLAGFANQLITADGSAAVVKLVLLRDRDQAATIERALGAPSGPRQPVARVYPSIRISGRNFRPRGLPENLELDKFSAAAPLPRIEFFTTPDPKPEPDAKIEPGSAWGALRLIQTSTNNAVRRADGKEWDAVVKLNERGTDLVLAVSIVFDQPLPTLDRWPTAPHCRAAHRRLANPFGARIISRAPSGECSCGNSGVSAFSPVPMISIDELLVPVREDAPCGDDPWATAVLSELETMIQGKPETQFSAAEEPDWGALRARTLEVAATTKDLRVASILAATLLRTESLAGFGSAVKLIRGYVEKFWDGVFPVLDATENNDPSERINALGSLSVPVGTDGDLLRIIYGLRKAPLLSAPRTGRFGLEHYHAVREQTPWPAEAGQAPTAGLLDGAKQEVGAEAVAAVVTTTQEIIADLTAIENFFKTTAGPSDFPSFELLRKELKHIVTWLDVAAAAAAAEEGAQGGGSTGGGGGGGGGGPSIGGAVRNRDDVLRALEAVISYYRVAEPSSPVPFLLRRAIRIVPMDFLEVMNELTPEVREKINMLVGAMESTSANTPSN